MSLTGKLRCLICDHERETFLCSTCVTEGNFTSTKNHCELIKPETTKRSSNKHGGGKGSTTQSSSLSTVLAKFSEKKARLRILEEEYNTINNHFEQLIADSKRKESLEQAINERKLKNLSIRKLINLTRVQLALTNERNKKTEQVITLKEKNRRNKDELAAVRKSIIEVTGKLAKVNAEFEKVRTEVSEEVKTKMLQLKEYIFPLYCEKVCLNSTATNSIDETYSSKEESSLFISESETDSFSTTCCPPSMGSWANVESNCQRYYIVEPWIPKYSVAQQYINWTNQTQEACKLSPIGEPDGDDQYIIKNDAYRISAALSYITQLLELASFITDVSFPKRLGFVEFHSKFNEGTEFFLTEEEILHKVAKLNINLIHLCLSQKIDGHYLDPTHTGPNLALLFDPNHTSYNRTGQFYIDTESHRRIDEALVNDYNLIEVKENEFPDEAWDEYNDWESVTSAQAVTLYASQQSTTSITSGIMSSALYAVTSFIRKK